MYGNGICATCYHGYRELLDTILSCLPLFSKFIVIAVGYLYATPNFYFNVLYAFIFNIIVKS